MKKKILGTGLIIALLASIGCQSITAKNEEINVMTLNGTRTIE